MIFSKEEKYFIASFVEKLYQLDQPRLKKYISLYSFLDMTDETLAQQKRQIQEDDPYFVDLLRSIKYNRNSNKMRKKVISNLQKDGFFENKNFEMRFNFTIDWLLSYDSAFYLAEATNKRRSILVNQRMTAERIEREKIHQHYLDNKETIDENYRNAMLKLATNGFNKSVKKTNSPTSSIVDNWGRVKRSKLEGDGNSWREQS